MQNGPERERETESWQAENRGRAKKKRKKIPQRMLYFRHIFHHKNIQQLYMFIDDLCTRYAIAREFRPNRAIKSRVKYMGPRERENGKSERKKIKSELCYIIPKPKVPSEREKNPHKIYTSATKQVEGYLFQFNKIH